MKAENTATIKAANTQVQGVARHSESGELLVVYMPLYGEGGLWVRPLAMFQETVLHDGRQQPRFEYIAPC